MVKKILMVCYGNTCRSPIAEAVMQETINQAGQAKEWKVDSASIGDWHRGKAPDERALSTLKKHNLPYTNSPRHMTKADFETFDYIFGMDDEIAAKLERIAPKYVLAKILPLGFFLDESDHIIEDPYYQCGDDGFEKVYQQCLIACKDFLKKVMGNEI